MPLRLFEFLEQFMIDTFLTQAMLRFANTQENTTKKGSFPVPPLIFSEILFKIIFQVRNCNKTCPREQVNKFLKHFQHANCRVNNF